MVSLDCRCQGNSVDRGFSGELGLSRLSRALYSGGRTGLVSQFSIPCNSLKVSPRSKEDAFDFCFCARLDCSQSDGSIFSTDPSHAETPASLPRPVTLARARYHRASLFTLVHVNENCVSGPLWTDPQSELQVSDSVRFTCPLSRQPANHEDSKAISGLTANGRRFFDNTHSNPLKGTDCYEEYVRVRGELEEQAEILKRLNV